MNAPHSKTMLRDLMRRYTPRREEMASNRYLAPIAHRFLSPELWRFTRRSVPRGVALGLFCAFIIPLGQIFLAAFMALPARANVPLSAGVTFVTNPFTFPFWAVAANRLGEFVLNMDSTVGGRVIEGHMQSEGWRSFHTFFEIAGVTAFGFLVLAVVSAAVGYVVSGWLWRWWVGRKLLRKRARLARQRSEA